MKGSFVAGLAAEGILDFTLFPTLKIRFFSARKDIREHRFTLLKKISLCY